MFMKLHNFKWEGAENDDYPNLAKWAATKLQSLDPINQLDIKMTEELRNLHII